MHLNVFVSQSCFINCRGCYSYSREEERGKHVSTDVLVKFLEFAYNEGVNKITLCGGDPLTRNDILELLERIKLIGFNISMDTVGSPIIKDSICNNQIIVKKLNVNKIAKLVDEIGIPIDGSNNEIFKRFRQTKADILNEQLEICKELHKYGANICINTVAHKGNLEDAKELARLMNKINYIDKWQIFQYLPLGKFGLRNREHFEITDEQFTNFQIAVLKEFKNDISKIQFKSSKVRENNYMLIDNSGNAWIPSNNNMSFSKLSYIVNDETIIGNIHNENDWKKICLCLDEGYLVNENIKRVKKAV